MQNLNQLYKIWKYVPGVEHATFVDPRGVNYKTQLLTRLEPAYIIEKGYLVEVKYFADLDDPESLVLTVTFNYDEELRQRVSVRKWMIESGEPGDHVKIGKKRYTSKQWAKVQIRRRENIIEELTSQAEEFGILSYVQTLFRRLAPELNSYVTTGDPSIVEDISKYSGVWLESPSSVEGVTLRQAIIAQLTFQV